MKKSQGFTLIELLVVIAIIGILASVVLVSLQSARKKGNDTRVISDVQQFRTEAESKYNGAQYDTTGSPIVANINGQTTKNGINYAGSAVAKQLWDDANSNGSTAFYVVTGGATPVTAYAIYGSLPSTNNGTYFCIDSAGNTEQSTINHLANTCQ